MHCGGKGGGMTLEQQIQRLADEAELLDDQMPDNP